MYKRFKQKLERLRGWTKALDECYRIQHIISGFCGFPEFTMLCYLYGILPGNVVVNGALVQHEE